MTPEVRLGRLKTAVRLAGGDAAAARRTLESAAARLPQTLDPMLGAAFRGSGLAPQPEIAVRRLGLRLRVTGGGIGEAQLTTAWARAIVQTLLQRLASLLAAGGGADEGAAAFADRLAAERHYLRGLAMAERDLWWWPLLLGRRLPLPGQVLRRWIAEDPERTPEALLGLAAEIRLELLLGDAEAAKLVLFWLDALREGGGKAPAAPHEADALRSLRARAPPAAARALLRHPGPGRRRLLTLCLLQRYRPGPQPGSEDALDALADALLEAGSGSSPELPEPLPHTTGTDGVSPEAADGTAAGKPAGAGDHSGSVADDSVTGPPKSLPQPSASEGGQSGSGPTTDVQPSRRPIASDRKREAIASVSGSASTATRAAHPSPAGVSLEEEASLPGNAPDSVRERSERAAANAGTGPGKAPAAALNRASEVYCGGLLYLVRPVHRLPLFPEHQGTELRERLSALARLLLQRVLEPLSEGARCAALEREAPLLQVFAGLEQPPGEPEHPLAIASPALTDAEAALETLCDAIPDPVSRAPGAWSALFGQRPDPFPLDHPDAALAALVLRPGRLYLSRTQADLVLPMAAVDIGIRSAGWDIDPGWVPHLRRVIRFHYRGEPP